VNQITKIENLENLTSLRHLYLGNNKISKTETRKQSPNISLLF
jgi:Leucine-rich repeat (LRR) protein